MRIFTGFATLAAMTVAITAYGRADAQADDCVNTAVNNPAFSSNFIVGAKPCPTRVAPDRKAALPDKVTPGAADKTLKAKTASTKSGDADHPTITTTPNGNTLLKNGDTTVCISGSVSATMVAGNGRLTGGAVHERDTSAPACD
jgi:hypothetical protein